MRYALHRGGARADDADAFVAQAGEVSVRVSAGVGVVPAAGMECVTAEPLEPGDARQLRLLQESVGEADEARAHRVAAVGRDDPARGVAVPANLGHRCLQACTAVE